MGRITDTHVSSDSSLGSHVSSILKEIQIYMNNTTPKCIFYTSILVDVVLLKAKVKKFVKKFLVFQYLRLVYNKMCCSGSSREVGSCKGLNTLNECMAVEEKDHVLKSCLEIIKKKLFRVYNNN